MSHSEIKSIKNYHVNLFVLEYFFYLCLLLTKRLIIPMSNLSLKQFFPAGGLSNKIIEIKDVKTTTNNSDVLTGITILPNTTIEQKVVIYHSLTELGESDYRAISASCPHQGADISRDELKDDGNVYCSLHKRPICVFSKFNQALSVEKRGSKYFILSTS